MTHAQAYFRSVMRDGPDRERPAPLWARETGPGTVLMGFHDLSTLSVRTRGPGDATVTVFHGERMWVVELGPDGPVSGPDCYRLPYAAAVPGVGIARERNPPARIPHE